ncbi:MAG: PAS-domain containing protein [Acetobacteraceae bacterium]|nr:PAS-domain containing protein [Acetobacteraceae bacterium]
MDRSGVACGAEEARLRAAMLDGIVNAIPHGICVYGPDRRVLMFNRAYQEIMRGVPVTIGDSLEEVIRRRAAAGEYGPGDPDALAGEQLSFNTSGPQIRRRRRPNGTIIDIRTAPLPDGGHISVVTDTTHLIEAEDELSRRAYKMDLMLANIRHGIILFGPDHRVIASNRIATELLDHPPGLLVPGRSQAEILEHMRARGEFDEEGDAEAFSRNRLLTDRSKSHLFRRTTRAGRALEIRSDPAPGGGYVVTYTDVSEGQAVELELRRAKEAAETANLAKSRFLATMSHELRTPLNAVIGFSEALAREGDLPDPVRVNEFAQEINDAGRRLLSLINNILDVARIESGRFELATDRVDLQRLLRACVQQADPAARAADITLAVDTSSELPIVQTDERRLRQVLNHLLSNAVKFTSEGGTITVSGAVDGTGELVLEVADTGIGIAETDLGRVFEPFIQLDGTLSRRFQGAGLGLYVSRALVESQGGQLRLKSQPGAGTIAEIRLPSHCVVRPEAAVTAVSEEP